MKFIITLLSIICVTNSSFAQKMNIYPTHWWVGMKNTEVQLMIRGNNIAANTFTINYEGVQLKQVNKVQNKNYVFLDLDILPGAKPGVLNIQAQEGKRKTNLAFELKERSNENGKSRIKGITSEDLIYLIMPDRFSNGDPTNDRVPGMRDQSLNRDTVFNRHGGDLKGVQNHLDYLQNLGVTAIWLNPVIENDMPNRTEHGYAFTDHYKVDARIGGNKAYHDLVTAIHAKGLKIIQDAVYNHTGIEHFLYRDMPDSTWFHKWPVYTESSYKDQPLFDPYGTPSDRKRMNEGWFGGYPHMPDINQQNPLFATFLIQHAVWSTEEYGLDGWRIDTYAYNDLDFMNRCNKVLLDEFPNIHLFGETWVHGIVNQAYFTENNFNIPFKSNLPAVTDFQTSLYGILPALKEPFGWTEGVSKLYTTLAQDLVYKDPMKQVIFLDNHDKTRFLSEIGEDFQKYKMGIGWLLTARGIPQLYYGTEVLMKGEANPDGNVRRDFPGGWVGDKQNKFTAAGRTVKENEAFDYVRTIANYRKNSSAIKKGKLLQYVPEDWVYTYFRYDEGQRVMVVMNTANEEKTIDVTRFKEGTKDFNKGKDIVTSESYALNGKWKIPANTMWILELSK